MRLALPHEVRLQVYKQFDKVAMAHLPTLLETLNARLASEGILPHLKFVRLPRRLVIPDKVREAEVAAATRGEPASTAPHMPGLQPAFGGERQTPPRGDGCWIDQHDSSTHGVVRRRLAWTSSRTGHALLLNRRSLRKDGHDLDGLARGLAAGWLQLVEDMHPAELAWLATLADLQRNAGNLPDTADTRMGINARRMPRRSVGGMVDVSNTMTDQTMGHLGNLSVGGMLMIVSTRLVEDALYQVRFTLPDGVEHPVEVGAHVLWLAEASAPGQFWAGLRFLGLAPEFKRRLRAWIELDASAS